MADNIRFKLTGGAEVQAMFKTFADRVRKVIAQRSARSAGQVIRRQARLNAPVLAESTPYRIKGLVRDSIIVANSRIARKRGDAGVFITVRMTRQMRRLAKLERRSGLGVTLRNFGDPFYFRFLETGTVKMTARPFLNPAFQSKAQEAVKTFEKTFAEGVRKFDSER